MTDDIRSIIPRIFRGFLLMYGDRFVKQWEMITPEAMNLMWDKALTKFSDEQINWALKQLLEASSPQHYHKPPVIPEFINLCKQAPVIVEERRQIERRKIHRDDLQKRFDEMNEIIRKKIVKQK